MNTSVGEVAGRLASGMEPILVGADRVTRGRVARDGIDARPVYPAAPAVRATTYGEETISGAALAV